MNFETLEPGLVEWVTTLVETTDVVVVWENAPRPRHNGTLVVLSCPAIAQVGRDETRWNHDASAPVLSEMVPTVVGNRIMTLSISLETLDQTSGTNARALAERVRSRVRWPSSHTTLRTLNLGIIDALQVIRADYRVDQRWVCRYVVDVRLSAIACAEDAAGSTASIRSVGTTATIKNPVGTTLPVPIQPDGVISD